MPTKLAHKKPRLIQRCDIDRKKPTLCYDYMGSSEFEFGDQAKSLKRILEGDIVVRRRTIEIFEHNVQIFFVARNGFNFDAYRQVVRGLAQLEWSTQEPPYLDILLKRKLGLENKELWSFAQTEAWFDFQNDVLFTLSRKDAEDVVAAIEGIAEMWREREEWLNSPPVKAFRSELEEIKALLNEANIRLISLSEIKEIRDGTLRVWLNPWDQKAHRWGWFTLQDLREWAIGKGPILDKRPKENKT